MYENGEGVVRDYRKAFEWLTKAAKQGYTEAQLNLGGMYLAGLGVPQDYRKAFELLSNCVGLGIPEVQFNLGAMYYKGDGISQDHKKAFGLFLEAAEQGYADAQFNLGVMYYKGQGTARNNIEAYIWLKLSAEHNSKALRGFNKVANALSSDQRSKADVLYKERKKAIQLRQKEAAERDGMLSRP